MTNLGIEILFWTILISYLGLIEDEHLNLFQYAETASEAWEIIKKARLLNY